MHIARLQNARFARQNLNQSQQRPVERVLKNQTPLVVILDGAHEITRLGVKLDVQFLDRAVQQRKNALEGISERGGGVFKARGL